MMGLAGGVRTCRRRSKNGRIWGRGRGRGREKGLAGLATVLFFLFLSVYAVVMWELLLELVV